MFGFGNFKTLAAAAVLVMAAGGASAATCNISDVSNSTACQGQIAGNHKDSYAGNNVNVNDVDGITVDGLDSGMFGINTWTEYAKVNRPTTAAGILTLTYDLGNLTGSWSVTSWAGIGDAMLVVKGGRGFSGYKIDTSKGLFGTWSTASLTNGGGNRPAISHMTLYATPAPIPLPAAGFLLLGALGGLAVLRRRRRAA